MKRFKDILLKVFSKREKEKGWNWIFRVGVILLALGIVLTITAIVLTNVANIEDLKIISLEPNDLSTYCGMGACLVAVVGIFFIFCGKVEDKKVK
ncbi:MAG: hypothetical protein ACI4RL_01735 [Ruminococcus sp.]